MGVRRVVGMERVDSLWIDHGLWLVSWSLVLFFRGVGTGSLGAFGVRGTEGGAREGNMHVPYAIVGALGVMNVVINRVYQCPPPSPYLRDNVLPPRLPSLS